jgi:hypothetical protein
MSYLSSLRLHFAGRFQANVSTVNNDVGHFDNAHFDPSYHLPAEAPNRNGWWNPRGDSVWRLLGCKITAAFHADNQGADPSDPIRKLLIADSDRQVPAKLVDLDPQQQLVSMIFGLEVRICDAAGTSLLRGKFAPAAFTDIWTRTPSSALDGRAGAGFQSILDELEWGDISASRWLQELYKFATTGCLSIKFNVDGFSTDRNSPEFCRGRIGGTIGPVETGEPRHLILGRHLLATPAANSTSWFLEPAGQINHCVAILDETAGRVRIDLGNALPARSSGGPPVNLGSLALVCKVPVPGSSIIRDEFLGIIDYLRYGWYEETAGVVDVPAVGRLTRDQVALIKEHRLALVRGLPGARLEDVLWETPLGLYARADEFVYRLVPGKPEDVSIYATRFGVPLAAARIIGFYDFAWLQGGRGAPQFGQPAAALSFPTGVTTNSTGCAKATLSPSDPKMPRRYIDGQVYGIRFALEDTLSPSLRYPFPVSDVVSVLLWDAFEPDQPITWHGSIAQIFTQYHNLYPIMHRFINMSSYDDVCAKRELVLFVFGLDEKHPNSMPVTRDLSPAKRQAIIEWLSKPGANGKPLLGTPPSNPPPPSSTQPAELTSEELAQAGKMSAISHTLESQWRREREIQ